jgi:hypothetical protein
MIAPIAITRAVKLVIPAMAFSILALIAAALFLGYSYMQALQAPSWPIDQPMVTSRATIQTALHKTLSNYQSIENLLVNRSSYAFSALFLNRLFPPDSGVTITDVRYEFRPTSIKGSVTCERVWTITGETTQEAQASLVGTSDPDNVFKLLTKIGTDYGYPAYLPSKKENVKVTVSNGSSGNTTNLDASSEKKGIPFTMVVSLILADTDPLAFKPIGK